MSTGGGRCREGRDAALQGVVERTERGTTRGPKKNMFGGDWGDDRGGGRWAAGPS